MSPVLIPDSLAGAHAQGASLVGTVRLHLKEVSTGKPLPSVSMTLVGHYRKSHIIYLKNTTKAYRG